MHRKEKGSENLPPAVTDNNTLTKLMFVSSDDLKFELYQV